MKRMRRGWMPRPTRRTRDRGLRIAAAALVAAGLVETTDAAWVPGNPLVSGEYYSDAGIDLDGDGTDDFLLHVNGYGGPFTLEPLNVEGINNWVFQEETPPPGRALQETYPVRRFAHPDSVLTAIGPVILPPDHADLYPFQSEAGFAGVHLRATIATLPGRPVIETFGYLEITYVDPYVTIGLVGIWEPGTNFSRPAGRAHRFRIVHRRPESRSRTDEVPTLHLRRDGRRAGGARSLRTPRADVGTQAVRARRACAALGPARFR